MYTWISITTKSDFGWKKDKNDHINFKKPLNLINIMIKQEGSIQMVKGIYTLYSSVIFSDWIEKKIIEKIFHDSFSSHSFYTSITVIIKAQCTKYIWLASAIFWLICILWKEVVCILAQYEYQLYVNIDLEMLGVNILHFCSSAWLPKT